VKIEQVNKRYNNT